MRPAMLAYGFIYEHLRSTSALRRTRWLQEECSVVPTRRSSRMTCACALGAQATSEPPRSSSAPADRIDNIDQAHATIAMG
eukprot:3351821-Prymnesium_polylepis.1